MKRIILLFTTLAIYTISYSQEDLYKQKLPLDKDFNINFNDVVEVDSVPSDELYSRAREWFVDTYKSADDVLQMEDKESGKLLGKAYTDIYVLSIGMRIKIKMYYTIKVFTKEGRYKYQVTDIHYQGYPSQYSSNPPKTPAEKMIKDDNLYKPNGKPRKVIKTYKEETIKSINNLVANLSKVMDKPSEGADDEDDW